jgi:diaminohydroxyphosphoribosylaminopyrimidine deaminase/5-amino-6-(5-phosphoribosylamino)uracil reductase
MPSVEDMAMMRRAIAAAGEVLGATWPNPPVGCVIAAGEELLGVGATAPGGRPHAEEQALAKAGARARGATAYVTLEPCGERSSGAPSCAARLIEAGVCRVVVACADASWLAAGRGMDALSAAGVEVETGLLEEEAAALYRDYRPAEAMR